MQKNAFLGLRLISAAVFILLLFIGGWILRNQQQLFGVDPDIPRDTSGARNYHQLQVITLWLHALLLTGSFALLLH